MATTRISGRQRRLPKRLQPRKAPVQSRSKETVEAVLSAASRILVEKRWGGLSMQEVASTAGVSPGTLYQYFPDKHALVAELIERISVRELEFQLQRFGALPAGASLLETLGLIISGTLEFQRREGELMRALLEAVPQVGRHDLLVERVKGTAAALRGLLEQHRDEVAHDDLELVTHVLVNAVHSLTHDGVLPRPATLDDATLTRELMRLIGGYLA
jgi:AcrR family transcriptional regulator